MRLRGDRTVQKPLGQKESVQFVHPFIIIARSRGERQREMKHWLIAKDNRFTICEQNNQINGVTTTRRRFVRNQLTVLRESSDEAGGEKNTLTKIEALIKRHPSIFDRFSPKGSRTSEGEGERSEFISTNQQMFSYYVHNTKCIFFLFFRFSPFRLIRSRRFPEISLHCAAQQL